MMQTSSARTIPGVWCNLTVRGVPAVLGILLAVQPALFAQGAPARLAHAIDKFETSKYSEAMQELKAIQPQLPKLADYVALYLASSRVELKDFEQARKDLAVFHNLSAPSPLGAKAALVEARALTETGSASGAATLLRDRYAELPQPSTDFALAQAYEAAQDPAQAATYYQRVYYLYPSSDLAPKAAKAMDALRASMGSSYPPPMPEQMLERGSRLLASRSYTKARAEFAALVEELGGSEREIASVRAGAVDYLEKKTERSCRYVQSLAVSSPEADAERLYYAAECARHLNDDAAVTSALEKLAKQYPSSPWRLKAMLAVANRFLVSNQPDAYEPLYRACYESFPSDPEASYCHWKVTWVAYLHRRQDAADLLREQVLRYPASTTVSGALYFLGRLAEGAKDFRVARGYYDKVGERYPGYYYGILSKERLAQPEIAHAAAAESVIAFLKTVDFPAQSAPESYEPSAATARRIERYRLLSDAGLSKLAEAELRFGAKTDAQPHLLAMELARGADAPHQGLRNMKSLVTDYFRIPPATAPERFWELLFPMPFRRDLVLQSTASDLDPHMVAGLVRQESEFNPRVISRKNAYGLTQIVPSTGRELARKAGIRGFSTSMLFQPATNLQLGTRYIRSLLSQWDGKWEQTLASYNAGKSRVLKWITWGDYREPAEFVETIPFTETREYVQSVFRNAAAYRRIYGTKLSAEVAPAVQVQKVVAKPAAKKTTRRPVRRG
jgi:soluble lytic murein transglycosylase